MTLKLTIDGSTANAGADAPERPGVFRLNVRPAKPGGARVTIDIDRVSGGQLFLLEDVPVFAGVRAALAAQTPDESGLVTYSKERFSEQDFVTAPARVYFPGAGSILMAALTAVVRAGDSTRLFVQRTPSGSNFDRLGLADITNIETIAGLHKGERLVVDRRRQDAAALINSKRCLAPDRSRVSFT